MPGGPHRNKGEKMSDRLTVSCSCGEGVYTIETGGVVLPQIVIDNRGVPQEQQVTTQEQSANQPSQGYTDPYDLFDYFFGNGGYSGSSARNAA